MSCTGCNDNNNNISLSGSWFAGSPCESTDCTGTMVSALCAIYNGPNLTCSGIETLDSLEVALQKIDTQICAISGDYSTYTMNCLSTWWGSAITTQADFVDAITGYACEVSTTVTDFVGTTYSADKLALEGRLDDIEVPGITCASASVVNTDTLIQVLTKYCSKFSSIDTLLDISTVTWNNCLTVVGSPTTPTQAFQLLADQICDVYDLIGGGGVLPVFNNYGTCIGGTGADSLVDTIGLIKTRLCTTPTLNNDNLTSSCFSIPTDDTDLETLLQTMLTGLDALQQNYVTFDAGDFVVTATDGGDPCAGITIALAASSAQDRFVAVSAGDVAPGVLIDKVVSAAGGIAITNNADTTLNIELANGDKGDITVSNTGLTWTIDNDVVTYAKMQNINSGVLLGRTTAGSGNVEEILTGAGLYFAGGILNSVGRQLIGITVFNGSGTWTMPTGCTSIIIEASGGSGGGGGAEGGGAEASAGGGGGSGAYLVCHITSGLNSTETVTTGAGGSAGASSGGNGGTGGSTSFGAHLVLEGGSGGTGMVSGTTIGVAAGGAPGVITTYSGTMIKGSQVYGDNGLRLSGTVALAGYAGDYNNKTRGYPNNISSVGYYGSGAVSLDGASYAGGVGMPGFVIVYEYS